MKLRDQILAIGLAGAAIAALVGGVGLFSAARLADAFDGSLSMGAAIQSSQAAAMMHGAIRGDVQRAMLGSIGRDKVQIADAQKALVEHSESLNAALKTLEGLPLSDDSKKTISATLPLVATYNAAAANILKLSATDSAAAAAVPEFQKIFNELEKQMALQVGAISKDGNAFLERSKDAVSQAKILVVIALVIATIFLVGSALLLAQRMARPMAHAVDVAKHLAEGNLTATVVPAGNDETKALLAAMEDMKNSFGGIVRSVKRNADSVATASAEIAQGNHDLSTRTELQASSLQETASSMAELNTTVTQNAHSADQANRLAKKASEIAIEGGDVVGQVVKTMKEINESSKKISEIISVIDGIAFQTNILALNAAVEAARAGEQGRGFAVVASEVRSLAGRSADAAKEIKGLINASVERVERGSALVDKAGITMVEVVGSISSVTGIMAEISSASSAQSSGVAQVEDSVKRMDETTQQNAALVEEMAAAASSLRLQAQDLVQAVAIFRLSESESDFPESHVHESTVAASSFSPGSDTPSLTPMKVLPLGGRGQFRNGGATPSKSASAAESEEWTSF